MIIQCYDYQILGLFNFINIKLYNLLIYQTLSNWLFVSFSILFVLYFSYLNYLIYINMNQKTVFNKLFRNKSCSLFESLALKLFSY